MVLSDGESWNSPEVEDRGFRGRGARGELGMWDISPCRDRWKWSLHPIVALGPDTTALSPFGMIFKVSFVCVLF